MIYYSALIFRLIWGGGDCVGVCANAHLCVLVHVEFRLS